MNNTNQQGQDNLPLVSVIIPSYNHGKYLPEAIKSIREQDYSNVEIIIVDDGSTDNTSDVVKTLPPVKYIYQHNQGLSAARNTGIKNSAGEMLVFLDADDWLLPEAFKVNVAKLQADDKLAFASGAHLKIFESSGRQVEEYQGVRQNAYLQLLQGNYIGMHAAVMYRKWVFDNFMFDENLRACEDYDIYLNVTRKHPVVHHAHKIAAYRLHTENMSGNIPMMLSTVLRVLDRQKNNLISNHEKKAFKKGHKIWKEYYTQEMTDNLKTSGAKINRKIFTSLLKYNPKLLVKYLLKK